MYIDQNRTEVVTLTAPINKVQNADQTYEIGQVHKGKEIIIGRWENPTLDPNKIFISLLGFFLPVNKVLYSTFHGEQLSLNLVEDGSLVVHNIGGSLIYLVPANKDFTLIRKLTPKNELRIFNGHGEKAEVGEELEPILLMHGCFVYFKAVENQFWVRLRAISPDIQDISRISLFEQWALNHVNIKENKGNLSSLDYKPAEFN